MAGVTRGPAEASAPAVAEMRPVAGGGVDGVSAAKGWADMSTAERVSHVRLEFLIGCIVFLTQLPESVAFAFLAKMTPPVGLHSAWIVGLITSVFGGRPGMISGAAGARATIIGGFLMDPARPGLNGEGVEIVFPAVVISGGLMLVIYALGLYRFTKIIPESVMIGFLNGIGILIVVSQVFSFKEDDGRAWRSGAELGFMLLIAGVAVLLMEALPRMPCALSKLIPSSLLALIVGAVVEFALVRPLGFATNTIGDVARITVESRFPIPFMLDAQYDLRKLAQPGVPERVVTLAVLLCAVGSIETLLTAEVVTEVVKTPNQPKRVMVALGVANILAGVLGGMGGDATIGLSKMNVLAGGTSRLSGTVASLGILACIMGAYPLLNYIPIAALTGIMLVLALHTFAWPSVPYVLAALLPNERWRSRARLCGRPLLPANVDRFDALIMLAVTVVSAVSNIVYATGAGLVLASLRHTWGSAHDFSVRAEVLDDGAKLYTAHGALFFGSTTYLHLEFDYARDPERVRLLLEFEPRDYSAIHALRKVAANYAKCGKTLEIRVHGATIRGGDAMARPLGPSDGLGEEWHNAGPLSAV